MEFAGKVVVVTGGGNGIGKAIALGFANQEAKVIIAEIDKQSGLAVEREITKVGNVAKYIHTDMGSSQSVQQMTQETIKTFGKIDILINNAATNHISSLWDREDEDWEKVIATNLSGPYYAAKYSSKSMAENGGGVIINIASTRAFMSEPNTEPYSAAKGGIVALTHSLATSLGQFGVRVNCISPGWIHTTDVSELTHGDHNQHLVGRVGTPQDIVEACYYLASDKSSFITGQNITIDGGMTKKMIYV